MLAVTRAPHAMSVEKAGEPAGQVTEPEPGDWDSVSVQTTEAQTQQFVTLYEALQDFDDSAAVLPGDLPKLAFAGAEDQIDYKPVWGGVRVSIGEPLARHQASLTKAGWDVRVLPGLDHMGAMHSVDHSWPAATRGSWPWTPTMKWWVSPTRVPHGMRTARRRWNCIRCTHSGGRTAAGWGPRC
ncbi:hypothetical protein NG697_01230 [Pseudarthrobacter sp. MDT3-26]|uniref:hypothetical protein n=1 Tax=Pseudarthrobacter raffinosi TaxID=2953651 RepID=UPI00208E7A66|nr:hypothetical protein [Pseudarthrobacter sp. MDT3-26]MCO4261571.1 hypothetical protein [Pseudarthrobacter sp. MDT3-26]